MQCLKKVVVGIGMYALFLVIVGGIPAVIINAVSWVLTGRFW